MAQIGLNIRFSGYSGSLIVVWKKATAPLTEVGRSAPMAFPVTTILTVPNLTPEVYNFEFWQSADGTTLSTLIEQPWSIDVSAFSGTVAERYEYVVNRGRTNITEGTGSSVWADPAAGDDHIVDQRYAGIAQSDMTVEMRGTGTRRADEWAPYSGGGIQLLITGEQFQDGDTVIVTVYNKTSAPTQPGSSNTDYSDVKIVSADATFDNTYKNKVVVCNGSAAVTTLSFPVFSTLADQKVKFVTNGMAGNYFALQFHSGDTVSFAGANRNVIYLAVGRMIEIMFKNNVPYVMSDIEASGYATRGNRRLADDVKPHQRLLDGTIRDIADYPGIVEWINTLPASSIVGIQATWNTPANKHKFYYNPGLGKFAFPDDRGMHYRALTAFDGSIAIGRFEDSQIMDHKHEGTIGTLPVSLFGQGATRDKGTYNNHASGKTDLVSSPIKPDGSAILISSENTVQNSGQLAVIDL